MPIEEMSHEILVGPRLSLDLFNTRKFEGRTSAASFSYFILPLVCFDFCIVSSLRHCLELLSGFSMAKWYEILTYSS